MKTNKLIAIALVAIAFIATTSAYAGTTIYYYSSGGIGWGHTGAPAPRCWRYHTGNSFTFGFYGANGQVIYTQTAPYGFEVVDVPATVATVDVSTPPPAPAAPAPAPSAPPVVVTAPSQPAPSPTAPVPPPAPDAIPAAPYAGQPYYVQQAPPARHWELFSLQLHLWPVRTGFSIGGN